MYVIICDLRIFLSVETHEKNTYACISKDLLGIRIKCVYDGWYVHDGLPNQLGRVKLTSFAERNLGQLSFVGL